MKLRAPSSPGNPWPKVGGALAPAASTENLLLWTEQLQQATWSKTGGTVVTADAGTDPLGGATADEVASGTGTGVLAQSSSVAATAGAAAINDISPTASWVRYSVTGTFDGTAYTLSVYIKTATLGGDIRLQLHRTGGVLVASLRDVGDGPTLHVWGWKLETPSLTAYVKREGT